MEPLLVSDPRAIGEYKIVGRLGSGGMGTVYAATRLDGAQVAIKVLRPELAENQDVRLRFEREASLLLRLKGARTPELLEVNSKADRPYLVLEYVPGRSLDRHIEETGPLSGGLGWSVLDALAEALAFFHAQGVVHRDLKPSNVIIGPEGTKILDFGISRLVEAAGFTEVGVVSGTLGWSSPEQARGGDVGGPSDIFSFGMLVAFAWTGRHPFGEGTRDALAYRIVHESPDLDGLPSSIRPLLQRCLAKDPADRPSAEEVLGEIRAVSRSGSSGASAPGATMHTQIASSPPIGSRSGKAPAKGRKGLLIGAAGIIVVALIVAGMGIGRGGSTNESSGQTNLATSDVRKFSEFPLRAPLDDAPGASEASPLKIDLTNNVRFVNEAAGGVYELKWFESRCERTAYAMTVESQSDLSVHVATPDPASKARAGGALEVVVRHVNDLLRSSDRSLRLVELPDATFEQRPIWSSIQSRNERRAKNDAFESQFAGIERPLYVVLSDLPISEFERQILDPIRARDVKEGWSLVGEPDVDGMVVDLGWANPSRRRLSFEVKEVIGAIVYVSADLWSGASDEDLTLLLARAVLMGLGASSEQDAASIMSIDGGRFIRDDYGFAQSDLDQLRDIAFAESPTC